jgi:hypothetical protein
MSRFIYPNDPQIISGLSECIDILRMGSEGSPFSPTPPAADQLAELLTCAYAASLETEEGRTITFTMSFFADRDHALPYRLQEPMPLSPRDLVRLAVALDPTRSRICVIAGDPTPQIAGLIHLGQQDAFHGARLVLPQLSIRVLGPAIFLVRYGPALILTYRRGRRAFHVGPLARWGEFAVGNALAFHSHAGRRVEQLRVDLRFESALMRIARTMLHQRHGGTVLILPDDANWEAGASMKRYAPVAPVTVIKDANAQDIAHGAKRQQVFQELMQGQATPEAAVYWADDMIRAYYTSTLEWLGRLTATDGMTVIRTDLTLLGFGIFFNIQESEGDASRVVVIDPYDEETATREVQALASVGGARHQSAAVTCRRFPGAVAVVASQDGSLSSMTWDAADKVVVVFHHLELLLDV